MRTLHLRFLVLLSLSVWVVDTLPARCMASGLQTPVRARTLKYDANRKEWVEVPPPPAGTAEGDLYTIRTRIKEGRYRRALSSIKRFVRRYGEEDSTYPDILVAKAEALIGRRSYFKAHEVLQGFLNEFGGSKIAPEALRLEFVIAEAYLGGARRKVAGLRLLSGVDTALTILDEISSSYRHDPLAELAIKTKADHFFAEGDHESAKLEYARLLSEHPQSRYHRYALKRTAEAALASFSGISYDEAPLIEAEERFKEYQQQYTAPADREEVDLILDTIRERRAEKQLRVGEYYERTDHLGSAVWYYRMVRASWPEAIAAQKANARLKRLRIAD